MSGRGTRAKAMLFYLSLGKQIPYFNKLPASIVSQFSKKFCGSVISCGKFTSIKPLSLAAIHIALTSAAR